MSCLKNYGWLLFSVLILVLAMGGYSYYHSFPRKPSELKIVLLADHPEYVKDMAELTYNKWKNYDPTLTMERAARDYEGRLNRDKVPFVLIALDKGKPIGMISLTEDQPIDYLKDKSPWLDDLHVKPPYDEMSITRYLMRALQGKAKSLNYQKIYVFTSDPSQVDWYLELGWKIIKTGTFKDHHITIMELDV